MSSGEEGKNHTEDTDEEGRKENGGKKGKKKEENESDGRKRREGKRTREPTMKIMKLRFAEW